MSKALSGKMLVLQIGETEIRAACLRLGGKVPQLLDRAVIPTPEGAVLDGSIQNMEALRGAINALRETQPVLRQARKVIFALCSTQIIAQSVCVPQMKNVKKMEQMILANADMYFPVDTDDYKLTWEVVGEKTTDEAVQTQMQMWATPKALLNSYYLLGNSCGLTVAAVDYCGHSYASGIGAAFTAPKPVRQKKASKKKSKEVEGETQPEVRQVKETADLYVDLGKDHLTMSYVQQGQVLLQRIHLRSEYVDADFNEIFMENEYFHSMFPDKVFGSCIVSGADADNWELLRSLEEVVGKPLQKLEREEGQEWTTCIGAGKTALDFGDFSMNSRPAQKMRSSLGSPWQYVLVAAGGVLVLLSAMSYMGNVPLWESELQSLRSTEMMLRTQALSANTTNGAQKYEEYLSIYNAYEKDWDELFAAVRTYNDNACLILEELENIFPDDAVLDNLIMDEESMKLQIAFQEKADVAYFLVALRKMEHVEELHVASNLMDIRVQTTAIPETGVDSSLTAALSGGNASGLMSLLGGGYELPPLSGSGYEAPPEVGGIMDTLTDVAGGKIDQDMLIDMVMDEDFLAALSDEQYDFVVDMIAGQVTGKTDLENLTPEQQTMMLQIAMVYANVAKDKYDNSNNTNNGTNNNTNSGTSSGTSSGTNSGTNTGTNTGTNSGGSTGTGGIDSILSEKFNLNEMLQNSDFINSLTAEEMKLLMGMFFDQQNGGNLSSSDMLVLIGIMNKYQESGAGTSTPTVTAKPKRDTDTSQIYREEVQAILAENHLTRQDLIDALDNLTDLSETHVLDAWYLYEPYGGRRLSDLLTAERRNLETKAAIRTLLTTDPLALQQFFLLMQTDAARPGGEQVLIPAIAAEFLLNPYYNNMIRNSDQAMLEEHLPGFIDMLTRSTASVEATEKLILEDLNLSAKLAGHMVTEMGLREEFDSGMNFDQLTLDILTGYTKVESDLDAVVRKMLSDDAKALAYYDSIPAAKAETVEYPDVETDWLSILMGLTGNGGDMGDLSGMMGQPGEEPLGNYQIVVVLEYKDSLIEAEQIRKGLDVNAKVEKVEVEE